MKSKLLIFQNFFLSCDLLVCPICKNSLIIEGYDLKCSNNHNFNISKKGFSILTKNTDIKKSKIYDKNLFNNRRKFLTQRIYKPLYDILIKIIMDKKNVNNFSILDLGCGEGTHLNFIFEEIYNSNVIGIDYSKNAIELATDYLKENQIFLVADVNNVPIKSNSIDIIINILSPFNSDEVKRLLKNEGYFIKIVPGEKYLNELREANNMPDYSNHENVLNNVSKKFNIINKVHLNYKVDLTPNLIENLIEMTPILKKIDNKSINIDSLTIDLLVYVLKG